MLDLALRRAEGGASGPLTVPAGEVAGAAGLRSGDVRGLAAVLRSLAGRVVEWTSPESWTIAPLLAEVGVEGDGCRFVLSPALRRRLSPSEPEGEEVCALRPRLAEFGLTGDQVERVLGLPPEVVERNLAYVERELAGGREIGALGAYTYRAIEGDWGGSAEAARRKRADVRRAMAARAEATKSAVFPPPALARSQAERRAEDAEGQRLDEHVAGLTDAERADLDAEAVQQLREQAYWGAGAVERALASGAEGDLGPAAKALTAARRDVMADWLRRGALAVLVGLSALVGGCFPDGPEAPEPAAPQERASPAFPLLGVWDLADVAPELGDCHEGSIGFRSDGRYLAKSGDQVVTGRYVAEPAVVEGRAGFLVVQRPEAHNGRPNCQGVPADVSLATSPPAAFVEVEPAQRDRQPERAWLYFGGQAERPALHLVRRTLHD